MHRDDVVCSFPLCPAFRGKRVRTGAHAEGRRPALTQTWLTGGPGLVLGRWANFLEQRKMLPCRASVCMVFLGHGPQLPLNFRKSVSLSATTVPLYSKLCFKCTTGTPKDILFLDVLFFSGIVFLFSLSHSSLLVFRNAAYF